eukprot:COSAG04_NODE_21272_length_376_cov_2.873646_1_plen_64_part_00
MQMTHRSAAPRSSSRMLPLVAGRGVDGSEGRFVLEVVLIGEKPSLAELRGVSPNGLTYLRPQT